MGWHSCLISACDKTPIDGVKAGLLLCVCLITLSPENAELLGIAEPFH